MLTPTIIASQTDVPVPFAQRGGRGGRSHAAEGVRSRSGRTVFYPANVFPLRRAEEATAPARGAIER